MSAAPSAAADAPAEGGQLAAANTATTTAAAVASSTVSAEAAAERHEADLDTHAMSLEEQLRALPSWTESLRGDDTAAAKLGAARNIRKLLADDGGSPPITEVIASGAVAAAAVVCATEAGAEGAHPSTLVFECTWVLSNVAAGTTEHCHYLVDTGVLSPLVALIGHSDADVSDQATWALGNLAGDTVAIRDLVLEAGALEPICTVIGASPTLPRLNNAVWSLSNLCRKKPYPPLEQMQSCLPVLVGLLTSTSDESALTDAAWALSYLSDGENDRIQAIIDAAACPRLVELLHHPSRGIQTPVLRTIGNIVTGDDLQTQALVDVGVIPVLCSLTSSDRKGIRKEACWGLSNIAAGTSQQVQALLDQDVVPTLCRIIEHDVPEVAKEALWVLSNCSSGGEDHQVRTFRHCGVLEAVVGKLDSRDDKMVSIALEALSNMLRVEPEGDARNAAVQQATEFGAVDKLEGLWSHPSHEVYYTAVRILQEYFPQGSDADEEITAIMADPADSDAAAMASSMGGLSLGGDAAPAPAVAVPPPPVPDSIWGTSGPVPLPPEAQANDGESDGDADIDEATGAVDGGRAEEAESDDDGPEEDSGSGEEPVVLEESGFVF